MSLRDTAASVTVDPRFSAQRETARRLLAEVDRLERVNAAAFYTLRAMRWAASGPGEVRVR